MPVKISVAMSKEIGPPACESSDVTCSLEFDDDSLKLQNLESFHRAVHSAVVACRRALQEEAVSQP